MKNPINHTVEGAGRGTIKCIIFSLVVLLAATCGKDSSTTGPEPPSEELTFEEVIASGGETEDFPDTRTTDTLSVSDPKPDDREVEEDGKEQIQRWICTTKTLSVLDGNGQFPLFNTNADVIYPANLLQGKTLNKATPAPIVVERAGGTISYNLNNANLSSTFTVDRVSKSSIQDAMNNIIANAGEVVPANFHLEIEEVQSENQLAVEMGLDVSTFTTKVKSDMSFSTDREYNRFLVKLSQQYYTMSFDLPTSLDQLFDESVTPEQLATYVQPDNPATFISSVIYGRIFYMLVESTSSSQEMKAKLDVSYGSFNNEAKGSVDIDTFQEMENTKIKVVAYGGDATGTFQLPAEPTIRDIADRLAKSTDIRAGLPLSYVVRSAERPDKIVGTRIATEYDVVDCELKGTLPPPGYRSLVDLFDDGIGAMLHIAESNIVVYNKAGTRYAWYNGNSGDVLGTFAIDDARGPLGASSFSSIGAAVNFRSGRLYIFDGDGLQNEFFSYRPDSVSANSLPSGPIGGYAQTDGANRVALVNEIFGDTDNFQFINRGFGAGVRVGVTSMAFFSGEGNEYAVYSRKGSGEWIDPLASPTWFNNRPTKNGGKLFERVGAATRLFFSGKNGRWLLVNKAGDEIMEYSFTPEHKFDGPWVIK